MSRIDELHYVLSLPATAGNGAPGADRGANTIDDPENRRFTADLMQDSTRAPEPNPGIAQRRRVRPDACR